jgi:hypothetical protein
MQHIVRTTFVKKTIVLKNVLYGFITFFILSNLISTTAYVYSIILYS